MSDMSELFWWTGAVVWVLLCAISVLVVYDIFIGLVCSVSWHIWTICDARVNGRTLKWRRFPASFLSKWLDYIGYRKGRGSVFGNGAWSSGGGYSQWHGVFSWHVSKRPVATKVENEQCEEDDP